MSLESRISDLESAMVAISRASSGTKEAVDAAILAVSGQGYIPSFSVMPYEGGYRVWCPYGTTISFNGINYSFIGQDENGWINLGQVDSGNVYVFIRSATAGFAEIGMSVPLGSIYSIEIARILE